MAASELLDLLACPHCRGPLSETPERRSVRCPNGHGFDRGRQGYLNLLAAGQPRNADTAAMVAARDRFLSSGHYDRIVALLADCVAGTGSPTTLLDAGAGTGFYLAELLSGLPEARGVGLDVSVAACRRAARAHSRLVAVVADVWRGLPVPDGRFDVVTSIFAPRNAAEFARVLRPTGRLVVVHAESGHLAELRAALSLLAVEPGKTDRLEQALADRFAHEASQRLRFTAEFDATALADLVLMGPNAFHVADDRLAEQLAGLALPVPVTVDVGLSVWRPHRP